MISAEWIATLTGLNRLDKLSIMQIWISELAQQELDLIQADQAYPVWSPYDADEAAEMMLKVLQAEEVVRQRK